jgi:hypothetical protein
MFILYMDESGVEELHSAYLMGPFTMVLDTMRMTRPYRRCGTRWVR